jgi:hypothetical protein
MNADNLPADPTVATMLKYIASSYNMNSADLSRMFQTTQSTIHYWFKNGRISHKNLMKVRASFYYLNNTADPHVRQRKCTSCGKWLPLARFREGKALCRDCEKKKTLEYYWQNREEQLKKRKAKNWYNKNKRTSPA